MLEKAFLEVLNMSFTASLVILFVLGARLLLKKSPAMISYALWSVVLFRLVCPFSFESDLSLLPIKTNPISQDIIYEGVPTIGTGISAIDHSVNQLLPAATPAASVNPLQIWIFVGTVVWLLGMGILAAYSMITLWKLQRRLKNAIHEKDNIYTTGNLDTPFVIGILRPKIYLPASLTEAEKTYILLHEKMHIRRFDHVTRIVSFFVLCLHWFNPLVWVAFLVSGRDMEMSCDEAVIKQLGNEVKKEYSSSLLTLATGRRNIGGTPLAFGEGDTKGRIKNVLNYKRPSFWVVAIALTVALIIGIGSLVNPINTIYLEDADDMHFSTAILDRVVYGTFIIDDKIMDFPRAKAPEVADFIANLRIDKKPISTNRGEERDNTNQIHLAYEGFGDNGAIYNLYFNFNADFTQVWLDNETKPSLSYQVKKPEEVRTFLEKQSRSIAPIKEVGSAEELWKARTKYIGDNSAVGKLISLLPVPESLQYDHFKLHTAEEPYDIEIVYWVPTEKLKEYDTENTPIVDAFRKNALLLLALVDNAEGVRAVLTDGEREVGFVNGREWADYTIGGDIREYAESPEKLEELLDFPIGPFSDRENFGTN